MHSFPRVRKDYADPHARIETVSIVCVENISGGTGKLASFCFATQLLRVEGCTSNCKTSFPDKATNSALKAKSFA